MLKRVQHDKNKYVIPNLFRNLEFGNNNKLITFVLVQKFWIPRVKHGAGSVNPGMTNRVKSLLTHYTNQVSLWV